MNATLNPRMADVLAASDEDLGPIFDRGEPDIFESMGMTPVGASSLSIRTPSSGSCGGSEAELEPSSIAGGGEKDNPYFGAAIYKVIDMTDIPDPRTWKSRHPVGPRLCNKCGYSGQDITHPRPGGTGECGYVAKLVDPKDLGYGEYRPNPTRMVDGVPVKAGKGVFSYSATPQQQEPAVIEPTDREVVSLIENKLSYLGLNTSDPFDARDAMHAVALERIGLSIGFGRAQQLLGKMWDHHFNVAPRGSMGVTVQDDRASQPSGAAGGEVADDIVDRCDSFTPEEIYAEGRRDQWTDDKALIEVSAATRKSAARWDMLPAFLEKHQIDYVELVRDIDAEIDPASLASPSSGGWISVDERLPPPFVDVLVYPRPTDYCCEAHHHKGVWKYGEYEAHNGHVVTPCRVKYWQQISPPAPKPGDKSHE